MTAGRPLKFHSPDELQAKIDSYFASEDELLWTWTGLALALDTDRETLSSYKDRPEFTDSIKTALLKVQNAYERDLRRKGRSGDIFALKNFGWKDQQHQDVTSNGQGILVYLPNNQNGNMEATPETGESTS